MVTFDLRANRSYTSPFFNAICTLWCDKYELKDSIFTFRWLNFSNLYFLAVALVLSLNLIPPKQETLQNHDKENTSFFKVIKTNLREIFR